jgi:hypothetical protein
MKKTIIPLVLFLFAPFLHAQTYTISNGTTTTCSGFFYDSGGKQGNYRENEHYSFTITSADPEAILTLKFSKFDLKEGDCLAVYDGKSIESILLNKYTKDNPVEYDLKSSSGSLTFSFFSSPHGSGEGWEADISCIKSKPTGSNIITNGKTTGVVLIYLLKGLKSKEDGEVLIRILSKENYIIASEVHFEQNNIYVTSINADYTYTIKDLLLSSESILGYEISVDFLREALPHNDNH